MTLKLVVFDLDFTLWDCGGTFCDETMPPFMLKNNKVTDSWGRQIKLYDEVLPILNFLKENSILAAIASRTHQPDWALELLELLKVKGRFDYLEIFPGTKSQHVKNIQERAGVSFKEMLFFDDEHRNIEDVSELGVRSVYVREGINMKILLEQMRKFS